MKLSLIIATYNWPDALVLTLKSIENQTISPDEVIIADDGSSDETQKVISKFQQDSELKIIHSWQEDLGFRVAKSRNKAIAKSCGDYIILIDGDIILHPKFVQDHVNNAQVGYFIQGTRVLLTQDKTRETLKRMSINFSFLSKGIKNRKNAIYSDFLTKLFSIKMNYLRGIKTSNMAFFKQDCVNVNGFNNDFEGWGREDSEFAVRLLNSGISRKNIRFNAIQFHLWHFEITRESLSQNNVILNSSINNKSNWCINGIDKYL